MYLERPKCIKSIPAINYSFKVKQVAKKKLCLANIQIVKMFELFENERTKTIHSSIVHSSETRGLCLLISYYSMKDQGGINHSKK